MFSWSIRRLHWIVCLLGLVIVTVLVGCFDLWIVPGLVLDVFGVVLLGIDLLCLQYVMRKRANENINTIEKFTKEYGGIQSWAEHIRKSARWVETNEMLRYHIVDDEGNFNTRSALEELSNLANCVEGLAENLSEFIELFGRNAERDRQAANRSFEWSIIGLTLIVFGFSLQIVGAWSA